MSVEDEVADTQTETTEEVEKPQEESTTEVEETDKPEIEHTPYEKKMFERAKLAEAEAKKLKKQLEQQKPQVTSPAKDSDLSSKDLYALMESKVPQADIDEVIKASKLLGKSVAETLQDGFVKARLKDLNEQRETANATNTTGSKRTTVKLDDAGLVEKALQGKDVDPEVLATARINLKKSQKK